MNMVEQGALREAGSHGPAPAGAGVNDGAAVLLPQDRAAMAVYPAISQLQAPAVKAALLQKRYYKWDVLVNCLRAADMAAILLAGFAGHYLKFGQPFPSDPAAYLFLYLSAIIIIGSLHAAKGYRVRTLGSLSSMLSTLFIAGVGALLAIFFVGFLSGTLGTYSRTWFVSTAVIGTTALILHRILLSAFVQKAMRAGQLLERIVLVGANEVANKMIDTMSRGKSRGVQILGLFEDRMSRLLTPCSGVPVLGSTDDLLAYVRNNTVDRIVVALPWINSNRINDLLKKLRTVPVRVDLVPHDMVWHFPISTLERLGGVPVLTIANGKVDEQIGLVKRMEDIVISSLLLALVSPVLALVALAIKLDSKGPIIFKQKRHGFNNEIFNVYKFRSMRQADSSSTQVVQATRNDPRVTRVGKWLRKTSLDELPQLCNVLLGSMSIVGPRPHAVQHNHEYAEVITEYFARHNVKPGITGWAQVNGLRGETDTDEKMRRRVEFDLHYIENWSLFLDLKIIIMTAAAVWFHETAY